MLAMIILAVGGPMAFSLVATRVVRSLARRRNFVDKPGGHKGHAAPVALGGGIAIFAGFFVPIVAAASVAAIYARGNVPAWFPGVVTENIEGIAEKLPMLLWIAAGALVLHITGLIDDARPLGAAPKFIVQFAVAIATVWLADVRLLEVLPVPISFGLSVFWIVLIVNAFNFLDNMDGLSAGVAIIAAAIFAASSLLAGQLFVPTMALALAGSLLGFLPYNFHPASIYMGDAGSMVIGYLLSVLTVLTTFYNPDLGLQPFGVFVPVVVLAVPLYDVCSVCWRRHQSRVSLFRGDNRHFSHRLTQRGMSVRMAVCTIYLATAATALSAIILPQARWPIAVVVFAQCLCVVLIIAILESPPKTKTTATADERG